MRPPAWIGNITVNVEPVFLAGGLTFRHARELTSCHRKAAIDLPMPVRISLFVQFWQQMGLFQNWLTWGYAFPGAPAGCSIESGCGEGLPPGGPGPAVSSSAGHAAVAAGRGRGVGWGRAGRGRRVMTRT